MYADDTTLFCCVDNIKPENRNRLINEELQKVNNWLISNKLSLNVNKTKYMQFYKPPKHVSHLNLQINNNIISCVNTFNFLGLQLNDNLKWNTHIEFISKKITRTIGLLYKMKYILPQDILLSIYNTLVLPHLNYCIISWGTHNVAILQLQKRALRAICNSGYKSHSEPLFKMCNVLKINELYETKLLTFYHKIANNNTSINFVNYKPAHSVGNVRYSIRSPKFVLPLHRHEFYRLTCRYQLPSLLNKYILPDLNEDCNNTYISDLIKNVSFVTLNQFKSSRKSFFITNYLYLCRIENCYVCNQ